MVKMRSMLTLCQRKYTLAPEMCWIKGGRWVLHCATGQLTAALWWSDLKKKIQQVRTKSTNWRSTQLLTPHNLPFYYLLHIFLSAFLLRFSCTLFIYIYMSTCRYTHTESKARKHTLHKYVNTGASSYESSISHIVAFWNMSKGNS